MATTKVVTITCDGPCKTEVSGHPPNGWIVLRAEHVGNGRGKQYRFGRLMLCPECFEKLAACGYVLDTSAADRRPNAQD